MLFSDTIAIEQGSSWLSLRLRFLYFLLLMQFTPTHVQSQPSIATLPNTPTPEVSLQTCAHVDYRRGSSCPILERLVDVCNS